MKDDSHWTVATLKDHFDEILINREQTLQAIIESHKDEMEKIELHLNQILRGFPQEYCRRTELESIEAQINKIQVDHVQRRELGELKEAQAQGRGARAVFYAGMGVVTALISVALAAMYSNQLSAGDVSAQIEREAPWVEERSEIHTRIEKLEQQIIRLQAQLKTHEATDNLRAAIAKKG